jgi:hypothetical protein
VCVQIRQKIAATAKIKHAESSLTSYNVPNTPRGHNRLTVLQETLGNRNMQHTVRFTELAPDRFKDFWR